MPDFNARPDSANVEQIMEQIRARIREKRGVDYEEQQIHELAKTKLEQLLDPRNVKTDVLDRLKKLQPSYEPPQLPAYDFEDSTLFDSHRGLLRVIRRLLNPILKLFFNPNPLIGALNTQSKLNAMYAEREAKRDAMRLAGDQLYYELLHNLLIELTRASMEIKGLRMRIESIGSRLEFNERRTRALESTSTFAQSSDRAADRSSRPSPPTPMPQAASQPAPPPASGFAASSAPGHAGPSGPGQQTDGGGQRSRRRRRRRGRRGGAHGMPPGPHATTGAMAQPVGPPAPSAPGAPAEHATEAAYPTTPAAKEDLQTFGGAAAHPSEEGGRAPTVVEPDIQPPDADADDPQ